MTGSEALTWGMKECPALVLNADFRPLSYFPLSLLTWQEAVKAVQNGVNPEHSKTSPFGCAIIRHAI